MNEPATVATSAAAAKAGLFQNAGAYLRAEDLGQLEAAYHFSESAHQGQARKSGEPYITHPVEVATILAGLHLDAPALVAALLHDVMEDSGVKKADIAQRFGRSVAELVDGVSKLDRIEFASYADAQAENYRKMLLAMARDVRVMLIKLADRLHNMRTLAGLDHDRQRRIARETLDIYAPIANRMGLNGIFQELEDLAFRHLYPNRWNVLTKAVRAARGNRREVVGKIRDAIEKKLREAGLTATVTGREKHLYGIYRKMHDKHLTFANVHDIYGVRVIVQDVPTCYLALGALHALHKPIPGKFKDYIAIPKANGYQSLHTTLFGPFGMPIEVQIRTAEMHKIAEAGVASHWLYKSSDADLSELQKKTHQWLQSLLELQSSAGTSVEFLEHLKVDLFPDEVYVFTPRGKIMSLPRGATAVDFAYAVHTDIGDRCVAVKINHELHPLRQPLKNGDHVEIITASHAKPNPAWLGFVVTGKARSRIRHFLKTMQYQESAQLGERLLAQALGALKSGFVELREPHWERLLRDTGARTRQDVFADIGLGRRLAAVVARQLLAHHGDGAKDGAHPPNPVVIRGSEGMAVQLAHCCRPIPGDPIVGLITKGQGMVVHTHDCPQLRRMRHDPEKSIDIEWDADPNKTFEVALKLTVANQRGVLAKVAAEMAEAGSNIENVAVDPHDGSHYSTMNFGVQVRNRQHLASLLRSLRRIPEVVRIARVKA